MKNILLMIVFVLALSLTAFAQDERPKYIGGGVDVTMNGGKETTTSILNINALSVTNKEKSTTSFGGFVQGNLPLFSIFEFNGRMTVANRDPFGKDNTTLTMEPAMNMFIPVSDNWEVKFGGVGSFKRVSLADGATVRIRPSVADDPTTPQNESLRTVSSYMAINPGLTTGFRYKKRYTVQSTLFFDDMNNSSGENSGQFEQTYRSVRIGAEGLQPLNDRLGAIFGADFNCNFGAQDQTRFINRSTSPQRSFTVRAGLYIK